MTATAAKNGRSEQFGVKSEASVIQSAPRLPLRAATDAADFIRQPVGAYLATQTWLYFYPHEDFSGYVVWGRPDAADFERLAEMLPATHTVATRPHPMLIDLSAMDSVAPKAFDLAMQYTRTNLGELSRAVTKLALVRPEGIAGALVAGFFSIASTFAPFQIFTQQAEAMMWIGRGGDLPLVAAASRLAPTSPILQDLRVLLDAGPNTTLDEAASRLAISARTLQRRLMEAGTSLTAEALRARVRSSEKLLVDTDLSVTEIAFRVGWASAQHFSTAFRSVKGEPPSAWRARHR